MGRQHVRRGVATLFAAALVVAGCGDDGGDEPEAQPSPDVTTFQDGDFADIPLPPLAEPASERTEEDGIVVRSYVVRNRTPEDVLQHFEVQLDDAQVITPTERSGSETLLAEWLLDDGRTLRVTALPAPTADPELAAGADVVTQFSLTLRPAGGADHEDDVDR